MEKINSSTGIKQALGLLGEEKTAQQNILYSTLLELEEDMSYEKVIADSMKKYQIKQYNISELTPFKVLELYQNLFKK